MASNQREAQTRFEDLISKVFPGGYPCHECPIEKRCNAEVMAVKSEEELGTCEGRLWKYITEGE